MFSRDPLFPTLDEVLNFFRENWPPPEKMEVSPMVSGMINGLIAFAPKGGEVIKLEVADLQNTFIEFFKANSHLVEGLDDFIQKIENQIK